MRKLIFIINFTIINALLIINIHCAQEKQNPSPIQPNHSIFHAFATKFAALKNYLVQQTTSTQKNITPIITQEPPLIQYDPVHQRITLLNNNISTDYEGINSYILSPTKKYLIINTQARGTMLRVTGQEQFFGYNQVTSLIDTESGKIIKQFNGNVIMVEFSPDEKTLLIATAYNPVGTFGNIRGITQNPSIKHESKTTARKQTATGDILFYELFDIIAELTTMKLENVQATSFTAKNELLIKYDDNKVDQINLNSKYQSVENKFKQLLNYFTRGYVLNEIDYSPKYENISSPITTKEFIEANYDYNTKNLVITLPHNKTVSFAQVNAYYYSPQRNYIIINKKPEGIKEKAKRITTMMGVTEPSNDSETIFYSTQSNENVLSLKNIITYEFSPDQTKLITLNHSSMEEKPTYKLFDLTLPQAHLIKEFTHKLTSIYFISHNELIGIDKNNQKIPFDTATGETAEERQQRTEKETIEKQQQEKIKEEQERKKQEQLEQEGKEKAKQAQKELEKKKKEEAEEKKKEESFKKATENLITEEKAKFIGKAAIETLPKEEREKKEYKETIPGMIKTVQSQGPSAIKQAAKGIASDIKEYLLPTKTATEPEIPLTEVIVHKPEIPEEEDIFEEPEISLKEYIKILKTVIPEKVDFSQFDIQTSVDISNAINNIVNSFNETITFEACKEDAKKFVKAYNAFTPQQKTTFRHFFFSAVQEPDFEKNKQFIMKQNKLSDDYDIEKIRLITNKNKNTAYFYINNENQLGIIVIQKINGAR